MPVCRFCHQRLSRSSRVLSLNLTCSICSNLRKWKGRPPVVDMQDLDSSDDDELTMWVSSIDVKLYDLLLVVNTTLNQLILLVQQETIVYDSRSFSSSSSSDDLSPLDELSFVSSSDVCIRTGTRVSFA